MACSISLANGGWLMLSFLELVTCLFAPSKNYGSLKLTMIDVGGTAATSMPGSQQLPTEKHDDGRD
jgi:hypothetical protein